MNFGMTLASLAALYLPSIVFGALLAWSYHKEPRQFRNAIWLLLFLPAFLSVALLNFGEGWGLLPIMMAVVFGPVIVVIFLLSNAVVVIRHEDLSLPTLLPALLVYSTLYRLLPRKRVYDYIIIHGAGFMPDGTPTPLLRGAHGGPFHHDHEESSFFEGDHGCAQRRAIGPRAPWPRLPLRAGRQRLPCVPSQRIRASGLKADGVGSHTRGYYWPTAFIREFIAVTKAHLWPYCALARPGIDRLPCATGLYRALGRDTPVVE